jgi:hypothetical protein
MTIPALVEFQHEQGFCRWVTHYGGSPGYDLCIFDDKGSASVEGHQLLIAAEKFFPLFVEKADKYLRKFIKTDVLAVDAKAAVISIGAAQLNDLIIMKVTLNYPNDPYALWSVGFEPDVPLSSIEHQSVLLSREVW